MVDSGYLFSASPKHKTEREYIINPRKSSQHPFRSRHRHHSCWRDMEGLTEEEKKALRGSKFAPLPSVPPPRHQPRQAHPGGPMKTNKAAALAKFLERKLQEPNGLASVDPKLVELAVQNAKDTVNSSGTSTSGRMIHHVDSFRDSEESEEEELKISVSKKRKKKKKTNKSDKKKNKKQKKLKGSNTGETKQAKKKMKL